VLKGGGQETVVQRALQVLRTDEQLSALEPLLAFFASFVLTIPLVQQIMRWDMAVLRESPWYQEILQQGLLSGIALGLELKFGTEGLRLLREIGQIKDIERLEAIQEGLKTVNTLSELRQIYA